MLGLNEDPENLNGFMPTSLATDPNFEEPPSQRALHGLNPVNNADTTPDKQSVPFMKQAAS